ncbi:UNKNOWN [Stylonychia lemnae]|uniref:Transmembrane protein n=1 Tax=Stylonychia lemnae TaxID=5949 RepID=A0A078A051_STYLE|nr:UNKNOWN [Stylonychia lemnae]|eukprot:CDW75566.1 UNKNOWN [Stylonychia lemnae]
MKSELLEHDYFDTEILFHGQVNPRTDDHLREHRDLLSQQEVDDIKSQLKEEFKDHSPNESRYCLMEIQPGFKDEIDSKINLLRYIKLPMMLLMPSISLYHLAVFDIYWYSQPLFNLFIMYTGIKCFKQIQRTRNTLIRIEYLVHDDKIVVQYIHPLKHKVIEEIYDTQDIEKMPRQIFSKDVGFINLKTGKHYITENIGMWHDRQFFNSIIHQKPIVIRKKR